MFYLEPGCLDADIECPHCGAEFDVIWCEEPEDGAHQTVCSRCDGIIMFDCQTVTQYMVDQPIPGSGKDAEG